MFKPFWLRIIFTGRQMFSTFLQCFVWLKMLFNRNVFWNQSNITQKKVENIFRSWESILFLLLLLFTSIFTPLNSFVLSPPPPLCHHNHHSSLQRSSFHYGHYHYHYCHHTKPQLLPPPTGIIYPPLPPSLYYI
jgi:hypothetical protein